MAGRRQGRERHRPFNWVSLPTLMDHRDAAATDCSALRRILYAGSPISAETLRRALHLFGCGSVQFYSATEMWIISQLRPEQHDLGLPEHLSSCGTPVQFVEMQVVDTSFKDVPDGVVGEFLVRSSARPTLSGRGSHRLRGPRAGLLADRGRS